jgi:hypothetical protein
LAKTKKCDQANTNKGDVNCSFHRLSFEVNCINVIHFSILRSK